MPSGIVHLKPEEMAAFDELYSVSDLHMGGQTGFQIFNSGNEFAAFVSYVKARPAPRVALVINGDLVDFLAEPDALAFDPVGASKKLDRIAADPAFMPVWIALKDYLGQKGRNLIITLGNHDLELALPWVRANLVNILTDGNEAAQARLTLAFDGTGFLCRVGNATVLCAHGNEVDDWNIADHEAIRRFGRDVYRGMPIDEWVPNAGTALVIDVMNAIKRKFPFVDLLKPEMGAVIPTLLAVAPDQSGRVTGAFPALRRLAQDKVRRAAGLLGAADEAEEQKSRAGAMPTILGGLPRVSEKFLMAEVENQLAREVTPLQLVAFELDGRYLGVGSAIYKFVSGANPSEVLREALEDLQKDRSFEWKEEDDTSRAFDAQVGGAIDFILTGHTHLERALARKNSHGWYFNSGTWVRLIKLDPKVLADDQKFAPVYDAFKSGTMQTLDRFDGLVIQRRTVVAIGPDGKVGTGATLAHWEGSAPGTLVPVAKFTKKIG